MDNGYISDEVSGVSKIDGDGRLLWRSDSLIEGYVGGNTKPMSNDVST